jgi:hypothetical protein
VFPFKIFFSFSSFPFKGSELKNINVSLDPWLMHVIPLTEEAEIGKIMVQVQHSKNAKTPHFNHKVNFQVVQARNPCFVGGIDKRTWSQADLRQKCETLSKT